MKKAISLLLALLICVSVVSVSFCADAALPELPLDGSKITASTTSENHYTTYAFSLSKRGTVNFSVLADNKLLLVTLKEESTGKNKSVATFSAADFKDSTTAKKTATFYLDAGDYTLEVYGFETAYTISAVYTAYTASDGGASLSTAAPSTYFVSEWAQAKSHKLVVKKAYRIVFKVAHKMPVACNVKSADGSFVYKTKSFNSGSHAKAATDVIALNLKKGTYFLNLRALPGLANACETGGVYTIATAAKAYIKAPSEIKTLNKKTDSQTISYSKVKGVDGYQVQCSDGGTKWVQTKTGTSLTCAFKGLKPGLKYKFRVRSYVLESGQKCFSEWSEVHNSATIPAQAKIKRVYSDKPGKVVVQWYKTEGDCTGYELWYSYDRTFSKIVKKTTVGKSDTEIQSLPMLKLQSKQLCYVKVRAYTKFAGIKTNGAWSLYSSTYVK